MKELHVERIKAGDEKELRELFEILLPRIRLWAWRHAFPTGEVGVEDLVQDSIYKIYSNLHKLTPDNIPDSEALMRWCYVVTQNVVQDAWRKQQRKHEVSIDEIEEEKLPTTALDSVTEIDSEKILEEAIQLLPDDERNVLLRKIEGKTLREIAQELDISLATAHRRYKHALKTLSSLVLPSAKGTFKEVG
jgi:RNA polymerase sigma factor (sigma-70 family)